MQEQESPRVIAARLADLAVSPRKLSFVCVTDGYAYVKKDDGGSLVQNELRPNGARANIYALTSQVDKQKRPIWFAGERVVEANGEVSYKPKPIDPVFAGDPLASFPVLDADAIVRIKENQKKREQESAKAIESKGEALAKQLEVVSKQAEKHAPRLRNSAGK
jgi:hypothetical protein